MLKSYKRHYTLCADTDRNENKFRADPASESHPHIISNEYQVIETEYKLLCCCISEMSDGSNTVDSDFKKGQFGSRLSGSGCNWEIEIKRGRHPLQYVREFWALNAAQRDDITKTPRLIEKRKKEIRVLEKIFL